MDDFISVERLTLQEDVEEWAAFTKSHRPQGVDETRFNAWVDSQLYRFVGPHDELHPDLYLARVLDPSPVIGKRTIGAAYAKWFDDEVEIKGVSISETTTLATDAVLRQITRKLQAQCYREGIHRIKILLSRSLSTHFVDRPGFEILRAHPDTQEILFVKNLTPTFNGDPQDWPELCRWFLWECFGFQLDPPGLAPTTNGRFARFQLVRAPHADMPLEIPIGQAPRGLAVVLNEPLDGNVLEPILRAADYRENVLVVFSPQDDPEYEFQGEDCIVVTRSQVLEMLRNRFTQNLCHYPGDPTEERVLHSVFRQRYELPSTETPAGIIVDMREDNFRELVRSWVNQVEPREGVHFFGTSTGKQLKPGDIVVFYVWDSSVIKGGAVVGIAEVAKTPEIHSRGELPSEADVLRSGFKDVRTANAYVRKKPTWLTLRFTDLRTINDENLVDYRALVNQYLGLVEPVEEEFTTCYRHLPSEDLGYTYLTTEQVIRLLALPSVGATAATIWTGKADMRVGEYLDEIHDWIIARAKDWQTYQAGAAIPTAVDTDTVERFLRQVNGVREMSLLKELLSSIDFWSADRLVSSFDSLVGEMEANLSADTRLIYVPFGGAADSSALLGYHIKKAQRPVYTLLEVLNNPGQFPQDRVCLVFFDDIIATGYQATLILNQLTGVWDPRTVNEFHWPRLTKAQAKRLRGYPVQVAYLVGYTQAAEKLTAEASSHMRISGCRISKEMVPGRLFSEEGPLFQGSEQRSKDLQDLFLLVRGIGMELLQDKAAEEKWSRETLASYSVGYGGMEQLVVFAHNTPSCTLPLIWKSGTVNGRPWTPLFPRRARAKKANLDELISQALPNNISDVDFEYVRQELTASGLTMDKVGSVLSDVRVIPRAARVAESRREGSDFRHIFNSILAERLSQEP